MAEPPEIERPEPTVPVATDQAFWARVREHKIIQWGLAYLGAALALAHGQELVAHALHWPDAVGQVFVLTLIAGLPIALTLAWYHGHRGLTRVGAGELAIISLLLLIGAVFFTVSLRPAEHAAGARALAAGEEAAPAARANLRSAAVRAAALPNSVAVLPFENLSPNPDDAYFATGIHEQVLNQLAKIEDITSIARWSVMRYADGKSSIQEIARDLHVETVMLGSVRYADGNVRITTQLIDAATEANLWAETYTRPFENIFAIQTDIATQIAAALQAELAPDEARNLAKRPTQSPEAYSYFLRAFASARNAAAGAGMSPDEVAELHRNLDRAIELDPEFALAYAAKARDFAYSLGRFMPRSDGLRPDDRELLAVRNADRALAIDPETGLAYAALAMVHRMYGRDSEAALAMERALALSPNDYQVLFDAALVSRSRGGAATALEFARRAAQVNPVDGYLILGLASAFAGDLDAASAQFESRYEYPTMPFELARVELRRGNRAAAIQHLREQERRGITPPASIPVVAYLFHLSGADEDARRVIGRFDEFAETFATSPADWAVAALAVGDRAGALAWIERAARSPGPDALSIVAISSNLLSDPVLDEAEFVAARERLRR